MARERNARAFTLIEMLAVLIIIALLATMAVVTLRGQRRQATMHDLVSQLCDYDRGTRLYAERFGKTMEMRISPGGLAQLSDGSGMNQVRAPLVLPEGSMLKDLWVAGRHGTTNAPVAISIDGQGRSVTYGFRLEGPGKQSRWFIVAGLTGQQTVVENDGQTKDIIAMLEKTRLDAP